MNPTSQFETNKQKLLEARQLQTTIETENLKQPIDHNSKISNPQQQSMQSNQMKRGKWLEREKEERGNTPDREFR